MKSEGKKVRKIDTIPYKGKPDFTKFSDEKLKQYLGLLQDLIFSYHDFKPEKEVLQAMWKDLSNEDIDRWVCEVPEETHVSSVQGVVKLKPSTANSDKKPALTPVAPKTPLRTLGKKI